MTKKIGSMPVVPTIKISTKDGLAHENCIVHIRYRNPSIRSAYFRSIELSEKEYILVDPEILLYDSFKHQSNDIAFYIGKRGEGMTQATYLNVDIIFTKGEVL